MPVDIKLDSKFRIYNNKTYGFVLEETVRHVNKRKGSKNKYVEQIENYYLPTITDCLKQYIRIKPLRNKETITTIKQYIEEYKKVEKEAEKIAEGL